MSPHPAAAPNGVLTLPSPFSFSESLRRLRDALTGRGLTIFADIDQQAAARSAGLALPATHLVIFGNPKAGTAIMCAVPEAGLDLPLKVLVWEDRLGAVFLACNDPSWLAARHALPAALSEPLSGIVALLTQAVDPAVPISAPSSPR